jgi:hypothetical protein
MLWHRAITTPRWRYLLKPGYNSPHLVRDRGVASDQRGGLETPRPVSSNGPLFRRDAGVSGSAGTVRGGIPGYRYTEP